MPTEYDLESAAEAGQHNLTVILKALTNSHQKSLVLIVYLLYAGHSKFLHYCAH